MSFLKPLVSFPLNFASPFSAMTHNSSEIFWLTIICFGRKELIKAQFSRLLSALKFITFLMPILKQKDPGLFQFFITVQCHER